MIADMITYWEVIISVASFVLLSKNAITLTVVYIVNLNVCCYILCCPSEDYNALVCCCLVVDLNMLLYKNIFWCSNNVCICIVLDFIWMLWLCGDTVVYFDDFEVCYCCIHIFVVFNALTTWHCCIFCRFECDDMWAEFLQLSGVYVFTAATVFSIISWWLFRAAYTAYWQSTSYCTGTRT